MGDERGGAPTSHFGQTLKYYRLSAGLSQAGLATRSGLSVEAISTLERGFRLRPHAVTVTLLAEALGLIGSDREKFLGSVPRRVKAATFSDSTAREEAASEIAISEVYPIGADLGGYLIELPLGSGRYSDTFRVRDSVTRQDFAAKWLRRDSPLDGRDRFLNEQWALKRLGGLCGFAIPSFIAAGEKDERSYIVMSVAEGESLDRLYRRQLSEGTPISQVKILRITETLLEILSQMHVQRISHRDIQLGNVMVSDLVHGEEGAPYHTSLIDFGTVYSDERPRDVRVFWNEGTSRFSPPDKLRHPSRVVLNQDVFAVGILAYTLTTNMFPWSVDAAKRGDRGDLENLMRSTAPPSINRVNGLIDARVAAYFARLLCVADDQRASAAEALEELQTILRGLRRRSTIEAVTQRQHPACDRYLADPIHGLIRLTAFEAAMINTPPVQRLSRKCAVGAAWVVYVAAQHTRLEHAIGSVQVISNIMQRLEQRTEEAFDADDWLAARCYALLRDVGSLPFARLLQDQSGIFLNRNHNGIPIEKLVGASTEIGKLLRTESFGPLVRDLLEGTNTSASWIAAFFDDPCGVDVLDSVPRDMHYAGLSRAPLNRRVYDNIAHPRRPQGTTIEPARLGVEAALIDLLVHRFILYESVYTHSVKLAAETMIAKAVWLATRGSQASLTESDIEQMGEQELLLSLGQSDQPFVRRLISDLQERNLWKSAFRASVLPMERRNLEDYQRTQKELAAWGLVDPEGRDRIERAICRRAGLRQGQLLLYCPPAAPGIQRLARRAATELPPYADLNTLHLGLWKVYAFVPRDLRADPMVKSNVISACEDFLQFINDLEMG